MIRDPSDGTVKPSLQTFSDMKSRYGPNWGMRDNTAPKKPARRAPTPEELVEHYRKYGLQFRPKTENAEGQV